MTQAIFTSFALPTLGAGPVVLALNLDDSESIIVASQSNLQNCH